jgi:hypothetical protein
LVRRPGAGERTRRGGECGHRGEREMRAGFVGVEG